MRFKNADRQTERQSNKPKTEIRVPSKMSDRELTELSSLELCVCSDCDWANKLSDRPTTTYRKDGWQTDTIVPLLRNQGGQMSGSLRSDTQGTELLHGNVMTNVPLGEWP